MIVRLAVANGKEWVDDRPGGLVFSLKFLVRLRQGVAVLLYMTGGKLVLIHCCFLG